MLRLIERRLADGRPISPGVWRWNVVIETLLPTVGILVAADSGLWRPRQALVAPVGLAYYLFIALSTLRLSPALSRFTGVASAIGLLAAAAWIERAYPVSPPGLDFSLTMTFSYAAFLVIGGFAAGVVAQEIRKHVAAAVREVETRAQKEKLERDLELARSIQRGLLPAAPPRLEGFAVAGWNQPADQTGGDYYDWHVGPGGRVVVTLADVTGHGIGPALMAAACRAYGRAATTEFDDLAQAMTSMNDRLSADLPPGKLITLVTAVIDPAHGHADVLSAGHGPLLFYSSAADAFQRLDAHGVPFGVMAGLPYGPSQRLPMAPGDMLVLMTDGFFEWANPAGEDFGLDRLEAAIRARAAQAPDQIIAGMVEAVTAFAGASPQSDDLTAVVITRAGRA
jgi:serine phosphatase RsbU (regulator of sigma subunit)